MQAKNTIRLNYEQLKAIIEQSGKLEGKIQLDINLNECNLLLAEVNKSYQGNEKLHQANNQYYESKRVSKHDYAFTAHGVYQRLMSEINSQEEEQTQAHYRKQDNLENIRGALNTLRTQLVFQQKKQVFSDYLQQQITRLNTDAPGTTKLAQLKNQKSLLNRVKDLPGLNEMISNTRKIVKGHRDTDCMSMLFKFNWLRKPASLNAFNKIFEEDNRLKIGM